MIRTKKIGNRGEAIALEYLKRSGYKIRALNFRIRHLETDIIAESARRLVFFEVKTRLQNENDENETPLTASQVKNLKRALIDYCFKNKISLNRAQLDLIVISVNRATSLARLIHYRDIL